MNLRDEANAKSRTLSALKTQVFFAVDFAFSLALASSGVTMSTGFLAVAACASRSRCAAVSTCRGFCSTPGGADDVIVGRGDAHEVVAEFERELPDPRNCLCCQPLTSV
jgi:hypothetical protein